MAYEDRKPLIDKIEALRDGRKLVAFLNLDRPSDPQIPGITTQFHAEVKEPLFRVLKESVPDGRKVDLYLYTRGGDVNSVWPIVSLLREFDPDFEVLVPFRCHSGGTLAALGARRIVLGPLSELSPVDPSTGNQFNPVDPSNVNARLGISVEDVRSYREFVISQLGLEENAASGALAPFIDKLVSNVHPLALGNVQRVHQQIKKLAAALLDLHPINGRDTSLIVDNLTTQFFSHLHMINRNEALKILGGEQVKFASRDLANAMDQLLQRYKDDFAVHTPFRLGAHLGDKLEEEVRFVGGVVESRSWSYLFATKARIRQQSKLPPNVQVQIPAGQPMPLIPGLPREYQWQINDQRWEHNLEPKGVTR
jgi:hypothetical protein